VASSLVRRQAVLRFHDEEPEYAKLFITSCTPGGEDKLIARQTIYIAADELSRMAAEKVRRTFLGHG
jgi:hypothetical protein